MNSGTEGFLKKGKKNFKEVRYGLVTLGRHECPRTTLVETCFYYVENGDGSATIVSNGWPGRGCVDMAVAELNVAEAILRGRGYGRIYVKGPRLRRIETEIEKQRGRDKIDWAYGRIFDAVPPGIDYKNIEWHFANS